MDKLYRKFWCGEHNDKKRLHTINWDKICQPICERVYVLEIQKRNNLAPPAKPC